MSEEEIQKMMYYCVTSQFKHYHPNEAIPDHSVSIGNLYESTNGYHCQFRYLENGIIVKCTYNKKTCRCTADFYELKQTDQFCWVIDSKTGERGLLWIMEED